MQADPIRAPARAQDLTLRHRVQGLSRRRPRAPLRGARRRGGFLRQLRIPPEGHPGADAPEGAVRSSCGGRRRKPLLEFVRARDAVHPREVDEHFSHGSVTNYWGGSSSATTHLLDKMHYRGVLRVARRAGGIRIYAAHAHAPGPAGAAGTSRPHRRARRRRRARVRAAAGREPGRARQPPALRRAAVDERADGARWSGRASGSRTRASMASTGTGRPGSGCRAARQPSAVRFLAPFDPVVWDRRRFELLWGWAYRFEAYTPAPRRAARLLRAAAAVARPGDRLGQPVGCRRRAAVRRRLRGARVRAIARSTRELAAELDRMRVFLGLAGIGRLD